VIVTGHLFSPVSISVMSPQRTRLFFQSQETCWSQSLAIIAGNEMAIITARIPREHRDHQV
jgi:hypothetical protein